MENGDQIGKIRVIHQFNTLECESPHKRWYCECSCGNQVVLTENEIYSQNCAKACSQWRGEICAMDLFNELNVRYIAQQKFEDFDFTFDFYLPDLNIVIECDGAQHFRTQNNDWTTPFKMQEMRRREEEKQQYCKKHNITMLQIPFWDYDKLNADYFRSLL